MQFTREYPAVSTPVDFTGLVLPSWFHAIGAGVVVILNQDGSTGTFNLSGGEVYSGAFAKLVSSTCAAIRVGTGPAPSATGQQGIQGATGPAGASTGRGLFLSSVVDGTISNYRKMGFNADATTEAPLTAAVSPGTPVQLGVTGTPRAFISDVGVPAVITLQQGQWILDAYLAVNNNNGSCVVTANVYGRDTNAVETLLFSMDTPVISGSTPTLYTVEIVEPMFPLAITDRIVVKFVATKTGGAGATTVTLYTAGTTHNSHIHTPIELPQYLPIAAPTGDGKYNLVMTSGVATWVIDGDGA